MSKTDALPEFFFLLRDAQQASDRVDCFDLREDAASREEFDRRLAIQMSACRRLVLFCQEVGGDVLEGLRL